MLTIAIWALELVKISPCQPWLLNGILFGCLYLKNALRLIRYHVFWFCCYYLNRDIFFTSEIPSFIDVIQIEATLFFNKQLIKLLKWNHDWKSKKKSDMKIPIISSFENIVRFLWEKANLLVAWYCQIWNTCLVIISYDHVCVPWLWFHKKQSCKAISFTALKKVSVNKL